jgi:peptidoglycan/LPS O-acetylase OafA/YrhL
MVCWHPNSINSVVPGSWSIAAEMTFYLVFPALAALVELMVASAASLDRIYCRNAALEPVCFSRGFVSWAGPATIPYFSIHVLLVF